MVESVTFVKACQDFFSREPHARKIEIVEFKELTRPDKVELREMLIGVGYDVIQLPEPVAVSDNALT